MLAKRLKQRVRSQQSIRSSTNRQQHVAAYKMLEKSILKVMLGCRGVAVSGVGLKLASMGGTPAIRRYQSVRVVALLDENVCCLDRAR